MLNINMPAMDGFETARVIREREKTRDIPIIFISAEFIEQKDMAKGSALNAVDYITKPFDPDRLRSRVSLLANLHLKAREPERTNRQLFKENSERKRVEEDFARRLAQQERENRFLLKKTRNNAYFWVAGVSPLLHPRRNIW